MKPDIHFDTEDDKTYVLNSERNNIITCNATGYTLPKMEWTFQPFNDEPEQILQVIKIFYFYSCCTFLSIGD